MRVAALDLGKWKIGVAVAEGSRVVAATTLVQRRHPWRAADTAALVERYLGIGEVTDPLVLVAEWPRKYAKTRKEHKDIETLLAVGRLLPIAHRLAPAAWKGQVPKAVTRARTRAILGTGELAAVVAASGKSPGWWASEDSHDAWDALGILLVYLGRAKRGVVRP